MNQRSKEESTVKISVIIPIFNTEQYLRPCIESIVSQNINLEIILINDGSTDRSAEIMEDFKNHYNQIITIHQPHSGPSIARNHGMDVATGEYLAFIDSDDWIELESLSKLYYQATRHRADMIMGNMIYFYHNENKHMIYEEIPLRFKNKTLRGKDFFVTLMDTGYFYPMACGYLYKRNWIEANNLRFENSIIHEDELWTQIALCKANKVRFADVNFYFYRQRNGSIMHTSNTKERLNSLFYIAQKLISFSEQYDFEGKDGVLRSWIYVNIYRMYATGFKLLSKIQDSRFTLPYHSIDSFLFIYPMMRQPAGNICQRYYLQAKKLEDQYIEWMNYLWNLHILQISPEELLKKRIILIYNGPKEYTYALPNSISLIPNRYVLTLDRKYQAQAFAIVFYMPDLLKSIEGDIEKPNGQIWVNWSISYDEQIMYMKNEEFSSLFDIQMNAFPCAEDKIPSDTNIFIWLCKVFEQAHNDQSTG